MATKKTNVKAAPKAKAAPKKAAAPKAEKKEKTAAQSAPRHPKGRADAGGGKASIAKALSSVLAHENDAADAIETRLKTASNAQLNRLQKVAKAVQAKWGSREKLIAAISTGEKKSKDKDYVTKLGTYSLPQLFDLATQQERRTRA